jgi:hypothetical protein
VTAVGGPLGVTAVGGSIQDAQFGRDATLIAIDAENDKKKAIDADYDDALKENRELSSEFSAQISDSLNENRELAREYKKNTPPPPPPPLPPPPPTPPPTPRPTQSPQLSPQNPLWPKTQGITETDRGVRIHKQKFTTRTVEGVKAKLMRKKKGASDLWSPEKHAHPNPYTPAKVNRSTIFVPGEGTGSSPFNSPRDSTDAEDADIRRQTLSRFNKRTRSDRASLFGIADVDRHGSRAVPSPRPRTVRERP